MFVLTTNPVRVENEEHASRTNINKTSEGKTQQTKQNT